MNLNEFFDNSVVISINDLRLNIFNTLFSIAFKGCPLPKPFHGFISSDLKPAYKCTLSHAAIVRMAKCKGMPFVVIFEDDAYPCDDASNKLEHFISNIPDGCDMVVVGWNSHDTLQKVDEDWNRLTGRYVWGSHAYIIFESGYDKYLSEFDNKPTTTADGAYGLFKKSMLMPKDNLFIQYTASHSMNGYIGYIWDNISHENPPKGYSPIESILVKSSRAIPKCGCDKQLVVMGYFVNGRYNGEPLFMDWLHNVQMNYAVDSKLKIVVYTDNPTLSKYGREDVVIEVVKDDDFSDIGENRLKKIKYLYKLCHSKHVENADYISFFQSNFRATVPIRLTELLTDGFDIAAPIHPDYVNNTSFIPLYHNEYATPPNKSVTDIKTTNHNGFVYYQDGHIVGTKDKFTVMVESLDEMIREDKRRGVKIVGQPFDERYFNYLFNVDNRCGLTINGLNKSIYNRRGNGYGCRIYQIDKGASRLYRNMPYYMGCNGGPSLPSPSVDRVPDNMRDNPYFRGALFK